MDDLTREMDFSGGLSGEKGETSEFIHDIFKLHVDIDVYVKEFFYSICDIQNTFTRMDY